MNDRPHALERAFALAQSGDCEDISAIKAKLKAEGYSVDTVTGRTLTKQLRALIQDARRGS
jgi:hypothetical protein